MEGSEGSYRSSCAISVIPAEPVLVVCGASMVDKNLVITALNGRQEVCDDGDPGQDSDEPLHHHQVTAYKAPSSCTSNIHTYIYFFISADIIS